MIQKTINLYSYEELSEKAIEKALKQHIENNDFCFLKDDLTEQLKEKLKENNIKVIHEDLTLRYSLSYCQGDGLSFIGTFEYKELTLKLKMGHLSNYYSHSNTIDISAYNSISGDDVDNGETFEEFKIIFFKICSELEKAGYEIIEFENSEENFKELCELNNYTFKENGEMENL
jgi:hypothetical protein